MKSTYIRTGIGTVIVLAAAVAILLWGAAPIGAAPTDKGTPLKEAKLNIEHNATDEDTGFQGAVDSEGWREITLRGPDGKGLTLSATGALAKLGLTELFFETVEPENAEVPIADILALLPEGTYTVLGKGMENGEATGELLGTALFTHTIPAGPHLSAPAEDATVPADADLLMDWDPVTQTIDGGSVDIISYQIIVERDADPDPNMIGKIGSLSMYLPAGVTSVRVPKEFLEANTDYDWEVLAIEKSGNQTLSSGTFSTE